MQLNGCIIGSRRTLIKKIKEKLADKILVLSSTGIADVLIFKEAASKMFKIEDNDDREIDTKFLTSLLTRITH